jgi:ABC-type bacteriocin/lantibiotic exporter with double-glycine peptidase domain
MHVDKGKGSEMTPPPGAARGLTLGLGVLLALLCFARHAAAAREHDAALCGPRCLAFAAEWLGLPASVPDLSRLAGTDHVTGTSLAGLERAAAAVGLEARPYRLRLKDLCRVIARTPAIALVDGDHFYVVWAEPGGGVRVVEPPQGSWHTSTHAFGRRFGGVVLVVSLPGEQPRFRSPALPLAAVLFLAILAVSQALWWLRRRGA